MTTSEVNAKFDKFLADNNGKFVERVDSNALNQCFDLAIYWCEYLGLPKTIFSGLTAAHQIYDSWGNPQFERIPNSATFVPIKGDIAVWKGSLNGGIGHVAVATGEGDTNHFKSFDQNWVVGSPSKIVDHNYNNFYGVQRFITSSGGTPPPINMDNRGAVYDTIANGFPDRLKVNGDTKTATVKQGQDFVAWVKDNVDRAGKYDLIKDKPAVISEADKQKYREEGRKDGIKQVQALVNGVK